ncbi:MAG: hypothetical protein LBF40_03340 [Deltaproteobacteria bacterium]|jgi:hypothetical protein|nr:hypothetical protein [Deltaproteobacteria bacterium]
MTEFLTGLIEIPINSALLVLVIVALFVVYKLQGRRNLGSGKGDAIPGKPQVDSAQALALAYVAQVRSQVFGPQAPGLAGQAPPLSPKEAKALAKKEEEARKAAAKAKKEAYKVAEKAAMEEAKRLKAKLKKNKGKAKPKKNKGKAKTAAPEAIQAAPAADDPTEILPDNAVQQGIIEATRLEEPPWPARPGPAPRASFPTRQRQKPREKART